MQYKPINLAFVIILIFLGIAGCEEAPPKHPYSYTELALEEGMTITATNKNGTVNIKWLSPLKRQFSWGNNKAVRTLWPRKERFMGKLGAYDPAPQSTFNFWSGVRIVSDDSRIDFSSREELDAFLYQGSAVLDWVFNNEGWVVGFAKAPSRNQINIDLYRITINGKSPGWIKGSRPNQIQVNRGAN